MSTPTQRRWFSFSLRRMLIAFALLSVVFAGLRWWYVRVHTQDRVVRELRGLGCEFDYADDWQARKAPQRDWLEKIRYEGTHTVRLVKMRTPRSVEVAERVNVLLRNLPDLKEIWIYPQGADAEAHDAHTATAIQGLPFRHLQISWGTLQAKTAAEISRLPRLQGVSYWGATATPEDLQVIVSNPTLRRLDLSKPIDEESVRIISTASQLTKLYLTNPPSSAVGSLARLRNCELTIHFHEATDEDLQAVALLPNLGRLVVWDGPVTDEGASALARATGLWQLYLHYSRISDDSLRTLATLPKLQDASFIGSDVTESGLIALARDRKNFRLEVSEGTDINRIGRECPGTGVVHDTVDAEKKERMSGYPPMPPAE